MVTPKKPFPIPTSTRKAAQGALMIALTALQDERVREQLRKTSGAARDWAVQRQAARRDGVIDVESYDVDASDPDAPGAGNATAPRPPAPEPLRSRLDPTRRFGQKGIERRVAALRRNVDLVFPAADSATDDAAGAGEAIRQAIDELSRAVAISATMPINERRRARGRIDAELTRLENALVDAVLPPSS